MKFLLGLWQPKNKFCKFLKGIVKVMAICLLLGFLILPFICFDEAVQDIIKWIWLGCAVCNIDNLWDYKKFHKEKLITPLFSLFAILTLTYLYNYWNYLSLAIVICVSIVIGLLEFIVSIAVYKTIRLTEKMDGKQLPKGVLHGLVLGGLYICALILFILGHFINQNMIFIFGGISLIMLSASVLICIGNGISFKKNIVSTISFVVDVISLLALMGYLIYLIPNNENLQDIVLNIVAAVVGGALTLAGVAWTIKKTDEDKKETQRLTLKPWLFWSNIARTIKGTQQYYFSNPTLNVIDYKFVGCLKNTDNGIAVLKKIITANNEYYPESDAIVDKDSYFVIFAHLDEKDIAEAVYLVVEDVLHNEYKYQFVEGGFPGQKIGLLEVNNE